MLDFGALSGFGVPDLVVGTPPFIPPEACASLGVDRRADLFALGAVAYYCLTGVHAYPGRTIREVTDLWRTRPKPPRKLQSDVPEELSRLVMELLQVDRAARPSHAGPVIERVCAIAGVTVEEAERVQVMQAYLATPRLVARGRALGEVRGQLVRAGRGVGAAIVIEGEAGSGRSRLLDECVLEAKLLGAHVLRADANSGALVPYAVARTLSEQLFDLDPELAQRATEPHRPLFEWLSPARWPSTSSPPKKPPPRVHVLSALCDLFSTFTRDMHVVVAVDDADAIDEPSTALLASLQHRLVGRHLALIITAAGTGDAEESALGFLRAHSAIVPLEALQEAETEELVSSVFGEAEHRVPTARRIHELAAGNPRASLHLLQHLVASGVARYHAGSWQLPEVLDDEHLPQTLSQAFQGAIDTLDAEALELAQTLSLGDLKLLALEAFPLLTTHREVARTHRALDRLVAAGIVIATADRCRFAEPGWAKLLRANVGERERRPMHARIAEALGPASNPATRAHHLLEAGAASDAIAVLLAFLTEQAQSQDGFAQSTIDVIERALSAAHTLLIRGSDRRIMLLGLISMAQILGDAVRFYRHAPGLLELLDRDCGLHDYRALDPGRSAEERLREAFERCQARYDAAPEAERGLPPLEAIRAFVQLCANFAGVAASQTDIELIERIPSLEPFFVLSPEVRAVSELSIATGHAVAGRSERSLQCYIALLSKLDQSDRAGMIPSTHKAIRLAVVYIIGLMEARLGMESALARADELMREPGHRTNAERLRMVFHLMRGDWQAAQDAQQRAELLKLQELDGQRYPASTVHTEAVAYLLSDDLLGMKRAAHRAAQALPKSPGLFVVEQLCLSQYHRMQGDHARALQLLEPVLQKVVAGRHMLWPWLAATHLQLLTASEAMDEAATTGERYLALCAAEQLGVGALAIAVWVVQALTMTGQLERAAVLAESSVASAETLGVRGLMLSALFEQRARVAAAARDAEAFWRWTDKFVAECTPDRNPLSRNKYERLLQAGREAGISAGALERASLRPAAMPSQAPLALARERLQACATPEQRAACALRIVLEQMQAHSGFLFGWRNAELCVLGASSEQPIPNGLTAWVLTLLRKIAHGSERTATLLPADGVLGSTYDPTFADAQGQLLVALPLTSLRDGEPITGAVAVVAGAARSGASVDRGLLEVLTQALLEHRDIDPLTCMV